MWSKEGCITYWTFHLICLPLPLLLIGITHRKGIGIIHQKKLTGKFLFQTWIGLKTFPAMIIKNSQEEIFYILGEFKKYWYE